MTCCARFNSWLWNTPGYTQEEKAVNHIRSHDNVSDQCLFIFRVFAALVCIVHAFYFWILWQYDDETELHLPLVYFTNWSLYVTIVYFLLNSVAYLRHPKNKTTLPEGEATGSFWKWCSFLYTLSFAANMMTTLIFWLVLYPELIKTRQMKYGWVSLHGGPLAFTFIDFALNRIIIERNQWVLVLLFGLIYAVMLAIFTVSDDHYIYPMFKLKTTGSWVFLFSQNIFGVIVHFLIYAFDKCKYKCCCPRK